MDNAKSGVKHKSHCQFSDEAGNQRWWVCMASQILPLDCNSLAWGFLVEPSTHLPDYSVDCLKGPIHHLLRVEPTICKPNHIRVTVYNGYNLEIKLLSIRIVTIFNYIHSFIYKYLRTFTIFKSWISKIQKWIRHSPCPWGLGTFQWDWGTCTDYFNRLCWSQRQEAENLFWSTSA